MEKRTEIEKERKFLMKNLPELDYEKAYEIMQFYEDGWRYRCETPVLPTGFAPFEKYWKLKKQKIGKGINKEVDIEEIDKMDFFNAMKGSTSSRMEIRKTRYVYEYKEFKFEIDVFRNLTLVMMEVEGVDMDTEIEFPELIQTSIIMEVTGNKAFDNYNLAP